MDILFIVEHPRFREFYDELINGGLAAVDTGASSANAMGDMVTAELKDGYKKYDIAWINIMRESEELLEMPMPDVDRMETFTAYTLQQLRRYLATDGETFVSQAVAMKTTFGKFTVKADLFTADNYREYLQKLLRTVTHMQNHNMPVFQIGEAMLMQTLDRYIRQRLFGQGIRPLQRQRLEDTVGTERCCDAAYYKGNVTRAIQFAATGTIYRGRSGTDVVFKRR